MGSFSIWHWLIVLAVVLLLFGGGGKIPKLMKDMGTGINAFKKGLKEEKGRSPRMPRPRAWSAARLPLPPSGRKPRRAEAPRRCRAAGLVAGAFWSGDARYRLV